jgi:RNA polymerase sigma-54 factor
MLQQGHFLETRQHQTTAHLAQTMTFLQMSTQELEAALQQELNQNPALELVEELRCPQCGKRLTRVPCPACAAPRSDEQPLVYLTPRQNNFTGGSAGEELPDDFEVRSFERLDEHILRQIAPALAVSERPIAAYLLARLDDDGLLPEPPLEAALYLRVPLAAVERVLKLIQHADPVGVGAQSPTESLLIQLEALMGGRAPSGVVAVARRIIQEHFELLGRHDHTRLARLLRVPANLVAEAAHFIQRNLTPYPARAAWGDGKSRAGENTYYEPDISIFTSRQPNSRTLTVEIVSPLAGWLRVNPQLKAAASECASEEERAKWLQTVERAGLIAKCLQQRNHTLRRLMEMIATEQRDFIVGGDGDLRPFTRARVAVALGVHESTISRAVAGKSVALPSGRIVPLAKFFDRSLSVRDRVRAIVEAESKPLTDDEIADRLAEAGLQVARRTVAKYRNMLGILPANLRAMPRTNGRARKAKVQPLPVLAGPSITLAAGAD